MLAEHTLPTLLGMQSPLASMLPSRSSNGLEGLHYTGLTGRNNEISDDIVQGCVRCMCVLFHMCYGTIW